MSDITSFDTERLVRVLTNQPYEPEPVLGPTLLLPPRAAPPGAIERRPRASEDARSASTDTGSNAQLTPSSSIASEARLVAPLSRLFLHFFDPHFLDEVSRGRNADRVAAEASRATRLAVLTTDTVFVPAASYIESDLCANVINEYRKMFDTGQITLVGGEANVVDFASAKLIQYDEDGDRYRKYMAAIESDAATPPFRSRERSATADIEAGWWERLSNLGPLLSQIPAAEFPNFEARWASVPAALEGRAFTPEYALPVLLGNREASGAQIIVARRAGSYINAEYFRSYTKELNAGVVTDLTYLHSPHTGGSAVDLPYKSVMRALGDWGMAEIVLTTAPDKLLELRADLRVAAAITHAVTRGVR